MPDEAELTVPQSDMELFRSGLKRYCSERSGDYDTVNLITTLKRTVNELTAMLEAYAGDIRITPGRINVLMTLDAQPSKQMPLSEIGDYLVVTRANITGLVDGLVKDGLVERIDHPDDRRMIFAALTSKGREFMAWFAPRHHQIVKTIGSCISEDDKRRIVDALDTLRAHVRAVTLTLPQAGPFSQQH